MGADQMNQADDNAVLREIMGRLSQDYGLRLKYKSRQALNAAFSAAKTDIVKLARELRRPKAAS